MDERTARILDDEGRRAGIYDTELKGTELEQRVPRTLVNPGSGELIDLTGPDEELAYQLDQIRELKSKLNEVVGEVSNELLRRMDLNRKWSEDAGDFEIKGESDAPRMEWDAQALLGVLTDLIHEQRITSTAADAVLEEVTTLKVRQRGLNALMKSPELAERIKACGEEKPPERRRVSVRRKGAV